VLSIYADEHGSTVAAPERLGYAIEALVPFWGELPVSAVKGETCRRYAKSRINSRTGAPVSAGTIRRELNTLQAAINHCHREGYLLEAPRVVMPPRPASRERWLTRREASWLLRAARNLNRDGQHLQDFIMHGLYTGSRKETILAMHIDRQSPIGGRVDTVNGVLYRKPTGKAETKKRQAIARLPDRYLAHLRRQAKYGRLYVVERQIERGGKVQREMVRDIRKAWARAIPLAEEMALAKGIRIDLNGVTPHTLKHTAITWALQKGASIWDAAGYFGTSPQTIEKTYGHHSPSHQESARAAINRRS
jgi:integrase